MSATTPKYGRRLLPQIVDEAARQTPDKVVYSIAQSADISQPMRAVTASQFAASVDKTAWWLREHLGETDSIQAVGYIGPRKYFSLGLI